jgi:cellulose synthase/poly-beta-1,6-N-acetylglucosamine synthase-like glycosyltransferase
MMDAGWVMMVLICLLGFSYTVLIGFFTCGWFCKETHINVNNRSRVSVVLAVRDEEAMILGLLDDLLRQDYPKELTEIIVVDDHSGDRTGELVKDFILREKAHHFHLVKLDENHESGKKAALSYGINEASGEIILTSDADCRMGESWISSMVAFFRENTQMVLGPVAYFPRKGFLNAFQTAEFLGLMASGAGAALAGHPFLCNGANLAYRKEAFQKTGGFLGNEKYSSGDDVFLLHKIKKSFGRRSILFNKDEKAIVRTYPVSGLKRFLGQRARWASKSKGYRDFMAILTAISVFSYSFAVILTCIAGFFHSWLFFLSAGLFLIKIITDFSLMLGITRFAGQSHLMAWYLPFQLVYPFYIVIAGVLSLFGSKKW